MSKGSTPRPLSVSRDKFNDNFDAIFGKKSVPFEEKCKQSFDSGALDSVATEMQNRATEKGGIRSY